MKKFLYFLLLSLFIVPEFYSQTTTLSTGSGSGTGTWTVPCGVVSFTVQCWGAGGGGGNSTSSQAGGGGGSGGYSQTIISTSAGTVYSYTVGAGGAGGGSGVSGSNGGTTTFSTVVAGGGTGGAVTTTGGGAGGSGTTNTGANGANPSGTTGGTGGTAPGSGGGGGAGGTNGNDGSNGTVPGGGGGAAGQRSGGAENSGNGANGRIVIIYVYPIIDAVASSTLASCNTTTATLTATAITAPGWTGSWQCVGCTGITIASSTSATTTASGFAPGSVNYFQWVATYTATGCSVYDDLNISVPTCPITNDNCASATNLTIDAGLMCGQSTSAATAQAGECYVALPTPNQALTPQSLWYRFTATNDSLVLNIAGYGTNGPPSITVFGPFASGGGCVPGCASTVVAIQGLSQDPGVHTLMTGLATSGNHDYLVSVQGFGSANWDFCINVANPANNSTAPSNALVISNCGATYNGSTNGGYFAAGSGVRHANLDNNLSTFISPYTNTTGNDVTFVVNNMSWFKFCSLNAGTFNVQFDVLSCVFSGVNSGSQMAILTGNNSSMTNIWEASNPTTVSTAVQTSPNFALAAGGCAYLVVDGFAGDACSYSYVLTNVSGGCVLLPIELISFNALSREDYVELTWATASEKDNAYFTVERSVDGVNFESLEEVAGMGTTANAMFYSAIDKKPVPGIAYYRLKQTDYDLNYTYSKIISVTYGNYEDIKFDIVPNPTEEHKLTKILFSSVPKQKITTIITNSNGIVVYEDVRKMEGRAIDIPIEFQSGLYFVKIITGNLNKTKKVIVK